MTAASHAQSAAAPPAAPTSNIGVLAFFFIVAAAIIGVFETMLGASSGSIIYSLVYFTMITQGCIAIVAVSETALGKWLRPIRGGLLGVAPMLFLFPVLFLFMYSKWTLYPHSVHPNVWHDQQFFIIRNVGVLLITAIFGNAYAQSSLNDRPSKTMWSILYIFSWVTNMSFVAFDWVMPLEWPWVSTLFGAYFFVESLYMGICMSCIMLYFLSKRLTTKEWEAIRWPRQAVAFMLLGFSVVWGHEFFSQYLVIWYGNLPEFNSFFMYRIEYFGKAIYIVPLMLFALPFVLMVPAKPKFNIGYVASVSLIVLAGLAVERVIILKPLAPLFATTAGVGMILLEFSILGSLFFYLIFKGLPAPRAQK